MWFPRLGTIVGRLSRDAHVRWFHEDGFARGVKTRDKLTKLRPPFLLSLCTRWIMDMLCKNINTRALITTQLPPPLSPSIKLTSRVTILPNEAPATGHRHNKRCIGELPINISTKHDPYSRMPPIDSYRYSVKVDATLATFHSFLSIHQPIEQKQLYGTAALAAL